MKTVAQRRLIGVDWQYLCEVLQISPEIMNGLISGRLVPEETLTVAQADKLLKEFEVSISDWSTEASQAVTQLRIDLAIDQDDPVLVELYLGIVGLATKLGVAVLDGDDAPYSSDLTEMYRSMKFFDD